MEFGTQTITKLVARGYRVGYERMSHNVETIKDVILFIKFSRIGPYAVQLNIYSTPKSDLTQNTHSYFVCFAAVIFFLWDFRLVSHLYLEKFIPIEILNESRLTQIFLSLP